MAKFFYYIKSMNEKRIIIIADDLTGANDTAIQFVKYGMSALVVTDDLLPDVFANFNVLSFNTDSRETSPKEAYEKVRELIQKLKAAGNNGFLYKKVDSVLRGNPGVELAAVMDEHDIELAIISPSFPANKSVLENGILKSGKEGQAAIDAVKIFADNMEKKVDGIPLNIIRQGGEKAAEFVLARLSEGVQVFVADAITDDDLSAVGTLSTVIDKPFLLAGAGALANQIAKNMEREKVEKENLLSQDSRAPVLVIAGTRQGETSAQISMLCETLSAHVILFKTSLVQKGRSEEAIQTAFDEAKRYMEGSPALCVIAVESMFNSGIPEGIVAWDQAEKNDGAAISSALGILVKKLTAAFYFPLMITTGGDTSLQICKSLGAIGIQPLAEISPGIPLGKIIGGSSEGRFIITKSGRFGNKDALVGIFKYIYREKL